MKNLATCKPSEFIAQTAKIKDAVANWVEVIDLMKVRADKPNFEPLPIGATEEEIIEINKRNAKLQEAKAYEKINRILDNMLAKHPEETLRVLALCCFVEPNDVDNHTIDEYLQCIMDMLQNKSVMNFFSLLAQLQTAAKSI